MLKARVIFKGYYHYENKNGTGCETCDIPKGSMTCKTCDKQKGWIRDEITKKDIMRDMQG